MVNYEREKAPRIRDAFLATPYSDGTTCRLQSLAVYKDLFCYNNNITLFSTSQQYDNFKFYLFIMPNRYATEEDFSQALLCTFRGLI